MTAPDRPQEKPRSTQETVVGPSEFVTAAEFKQLEKANIILALERAGWKTWGPGGAAELLGMKPSTLAYQMKMLDIKKTR